MLETREDIKVLEDKISYYAQRYYDGNTEITDAEFDKLVDRLRELSPNSEVLNKVGWGMDVSKLNGEKTEHKYQLIGSLDKVRDPKLISEKITSKYIISAKLDGMSLVAYYREGHLIKAVTRGNGVIGIDRTEKLVRAGIVPDDLHTDFSGAVRGELIISNDNWNTILKDNPNAKNSRNYAAGIINRKEIDDNDLKYIDFVVYNIIGADEPYFFTENIQLNYLWLRNHFDNVAPFTVGISDPTIEYLKSVYENLSKEYTADGLVLTYYDIIYNDNKALIYDQVAFKFESDRKSTKVTKVLWNLTRTQRLTPVLQLEPIELCGATIVHATAFNAKYIYDNKIGAGSVVEIERSGEVIPDIQSVVSTPYTDPHDVIPKECPVCHGHLNWIGTDLVCSNLECSNKGFRDLQTWMICIGNTDGISWTLMDKFLTEMNVFSIDDLYEMSDARFPDGSGTQKMIFNKVLDKIFIKPIDAVDALCALNIPRLGRVSAGKIARNEAVMRALLNEGSRFDFSNLYASLAVGPATIQSMIDNKDKLDNLRFIKDRVVYKKDSKEESREMINVAVTGKLSVKRADFEKELNEAGYVIASVNKDCRFLITDNPTGTSSKNRKASELGIEKITESEFRRRYMNG